MSTTCDRSPQPLQYQAMVYSSQEELIDILGSRTRGRVDAHDPVLVAVDPDSEKQLRELLGDGADTVEFVDPNALSGPAAGRVIRRFMTTARHAGASGPLSVLVQHTTVEDDAGRDEVDGEAWLRLECEVNATVENIPIDLVRLYDVDSSACAIIDNARSSHGPRDGGTDLTGVVDGPTERAPELGGAYDVHRFDDRDSSALRGWLYFHCAVCGLPEETADEFVMAVHEAATAASRVPQRAGAEATAVAPFGGPVPHQPISHQELVPVRIWPWLRRVTCEVPVPAPLPSLDERAADAHPLLSALRRTVEASRNVRVDVYRDSPPSWSRIRVCADRPDPEGAMRESAATPARGNPCG